MKIDTPGDASILKSLLRELNTTANPRENVSNKSLLLCRIDVVAGYMRWRIKCKVVRTRTAAENNLSYLKTIRPQENVLSSNQKRALLAVALTTTASYMSVDWVVQDPGELKASHVVRLASHKMYKNYS